MTASTGTKSLTIMIGDTKIAEVGEDAFKHVEKQDKHTR